MRRRWLVLSFLLQIAPPVQAAPSPGTLTVEVSNLQIEEGWELCALYSSADGFPLDPTKATQRARVPIHDGKAVCEWTAVKPGSYAVAVMRDENGDGLPDRDVFDLPKHGIGASNDAHGFMGPPKFEDARFEFKGGALRLEIHMTYHMPK